MRYISRSSMSFSHSILTGSFNLRRTPPWPSEIYMNCLDQGEDWEGRNMEN
jgi:hypothetical protein